jgi:hypothetical protein
LKRDRFVDGFEFSGFDIVSKANQPQGADAVPVRVELVPCETVPGGLGMGVMIVVPSFAEGEEGNPEAVSGGVGFWYRRVPHMWVAELTSQVE